MPYIKQEERPKMDYIVASMIESGVKADGKLNYVLYKLCKKIVKPSYNNYKNYIAELTECAAEIRRRFLVPYETNRVEEHGDID